MLDLGRLSSGSAGRAQTSNGASHLLGVGRIDKIVIIRIQAITGEAVKNVDDWATSVS